MPVRASVVMAVVILGLGGCGGDDAADAQQEYAASDAVSQFAESQRIMLLSCEAQLIAGHATQQIEREADRSIQVVREYPDAELENGTTLRQALGDSAEPIRPCAPSVARKIETAVSTLP